MELVRKWTNGDIMYPQSLTITPPTIQTDWSDPLIEMRSAVVDARDGQIYHPQNLPLDSIRISGAVAKGIWTAEEAQLVVGLILKAYVMWGQTN